MADKLSRRKIANYVADQVTKGGSLAGAVSEVAAYLIETRRTREVELVVRTIEDVLASRGIVVASVTTARPLDTVLRSAIEKIVKAESLHIREIIDPNVIGGVRIETPGSKLDATIQRKILALRRAKI